MSPCWRLWGFCVSPARTELSARGIVAESSARPRHAQALYTSRRIPRLRLRAPGLIWPLCIAARQPTLLSPPLVSSFDSKPAIPSWRPRVPNYPPRDSWQGGVRGAHGNDGKVKPMAMLEILGSAIGVVLVVAAVAYIRRSRKNKEPLELGVGTKFHP